MEDSIMRVVIVEEDVKLVLEFSGVVIGVALIVLAAGHW